jgi:hypothetical protein
MASAGSGFAQDILTRIINVHWATGGLAVEFGDKDQDAPGMGSVASRSVGVEAPRNREKA